MIRTAVILAAGQAGNLQTPACLLPITEDCTLTKLINELDRLEFEKIIVVIGYKGALIQNQFKDKGNIYWVENLDYLHTGTMQSLSLADTLIKEDFILIDGDLLIPPSMLEAVINSEKPNVTATSNLTGSGDETFIEMDENSYLIGASKDIRQLNTITKEMIGITKITLSLYNEMIGKYQGTFNNWRNYEYILLRCITKYPVYCLHFDNTPWIDIDHQAAYKVARQSVMKDITVFEENVEDVKKKFATILPEAIVHISLAGGMTNDNFKIMTKGNIYFVRVPGAGTESLINREYEPINIEKINFLNINAPTVVIDSANGFKITEYIKNSTTLSKRTARLPQNMKKIADILRTLHSSDVHFTNEFHFLSMLEHYTDLLQNDVIYAKYEEVRESINLINNWMMTNCSTILVPCHNDLVPENFILNSEEKLYLIDWEYSGMNDSYWDLASFIIESEANDEEVEFFLHKYFKRSPTENEKTKIKAYRAFQDILWAVWSQVKLEENIKDFVEYGHNRYERGRKTIGELLQYVDKTQ